MFRDARVMVIGVIVGSLSIHEGKMKRKVHYHAFFKAALFLLSPILAP